MIVRCVKDRLAIGDPELANDFAATEDSDFLVTIGTTYIVHAILQHRDFLNFLVLDKHGLPSACPIHFFVIEDAVLPENWYFRSFVEQSNCLTKWRMGYRRFVEDEGHYEGVILHHKVDLEVFFSSTGMSGAKMPDNNH